MRLYKAERKRGARIHRLDHDASTVEVTGKGSVGLIADETNRGHAERLAQQLTAKGARVKRLTITRGVNGRGAKDMGILPLLLPGYRPAGGGKAAGKSGAEIFEAAVAGAVRCLVLLGMESTLTGAGATIAKALAKADCVVAIESRSGLIASHATVLIPGHAYFEKAGSVTNVEGRVQRIRQALPPATQYPSELRILTMLANALGADDWEAGDVLAVNRAMCAALPAYREAGNGNRASFEKVPAR